MDMGPIPIIAIVVLLLLALIPAKIAVKKGYSFALFYILGILLFLPTVIIVLVISDRNKKHTRGRNTEGIEQYEKMLERGEITYNEFKKKKEELGQ